MRILQITSHLNVGGVTSAVLSLSGGLIRRNHRVIIASDSGECQAKLEGLGLGHWRLPLHTSVEFSPRVFAAGNRLRARLRAEPVDVIHAHTRVAQVAAASVSQALGIPYVTSWHGFFRANLGRRLWPCAGRLAIAISEPVRRHLVEDLRVPAERIRLIPHGIDAGLFEQPAHSGEADELRRRLRLEPGKPVVGTVARLVASKGVDRLVRSLPQIRASVAGASLLIVGDGEERHRLARIAFESGVGEAVRFAGTLPQTHAALSLMDVFVFLPAEQEGFGLALLEAMASGRPIVALRRGEGAAWVLEESEVGIAVDPGDTDALAAALIQVLQDPARARSEAEKARRIVKERYPFDRMVGQVEAVYREALSAR